MSGAELPVLIISISSIIGATTYLVKNIKTLRIGNCCSCEQNVEVDQTPNPHYQHRSFDPAIQNAQKVHWKKSIMEKLTPRQKASKPSRGEVPPSLEEVRTTTIVDNEDKSEFHLKRANSFS